MASSVMLHSDSASEATLEADKRRALPPDFLREGDAVVGGGTEVCFKLLRRGMAVRCSGGLWTFRCVSSLPLLASITLRSL